MSALDQLTAKPFQAAGGAVAALTSTPAPAASKDDSVSSLLAKPFAAAPAAETSPYFQGKEPSGAFIGISDEVDPYSGRPYLAYRMPGDEATTTDKTRVAPKINPEIAAPAARDAFTNPRMPESASEDMRTLEGATPDEQLDHRMALALGGSNDESNLKLIPTAQNQAAGQGEGAMSSDIAAGKLSLFQAQNQEAQAKGLPAPWTDQDIKRAQTLLEKIQTFIQPLKPGNNALPGFAQTSDLSFAQNNKTDFNTSASTPSFPDENAENAASFEAPVGNLTEGPTKLAVAIAQSIGHGSLTPLENLYSNLAKTATEKINPFTGQPQNMDYLDPKKKELYIPRVIDTLAAGFAGGGEGAEASAADAESGIARIAKETNANTIASDLKTMGVPDNLVPSLSKQFAATKSVPEITAVLKDVAENNPPPVKGALTPYDTPEIVQAREETKNIEPTSNLQTPAREQLRSQVADQLYGNGAANKDKRLDVVMGLPASGKSSAVVEPLAKEHGSLVADSDIAKEKLPEFNAGKGAGRVHIESSKINKQLLDRAMENGDNIVYPTVGDNPTNLSKLLDNAKNAGYDVHLHHVDVPLDTAAERLVQRFKETGRFVDPDYLLNKVGLHPKENYGIFKSDERVTSATEYSNAVPRGEQPRITEETGNTSRRGRLPNVSRGLESGGKQEKPAGPRGSDRNDRRASPSGGEEKNISGRNKERIYAEGEATDSGRNGGVLQNETRGPELIPLNHSALPKNLEKVPNIPGVFVDAVKNDVYFENIDGKYFKVANPSDAQKFLSRLNSEKAAAKLQVQRQPRQGAAGGTRDSERAQPGQRTRTPQGQPRRAPTESPKSSYNKTILEHNGDVKPPENRGGLQPPEIDWSTGRDKAAIRLSTDTMERNVEKIFPKKTADEINQFLVEPVRHNETDRVEWATRSREVLKSEIVDRLKIKPGSKENKLIQQYGEGRLSLDELKQKAPDSWQRVKEASEVARDFYDKSLDRWNRERSKAGMKPIGKLPNYFRHFVDLGDFVSKMGFNFTEGNLPTAISGITEFFRSQTPWASASMRRLGSTFTDDALGGLDNYIDNTSRAIFHTDSVQRGRLMEKYMREAAAAKPNDIKLSNFASNLNDWTNLVSGKQARLDRAVESVFGRTGLQVMRKLQRQFGANVIGGNVSAAVTHAIPLTYTLATVDKGAAFQGLLDTLHSPLLEDFRTIAGQKSDFLTRRYGTKEIEPTLGEKAARVISSPFEMVDRFISRFAVSAKYMEGISKGLDPKAAMAAADNYAGRVIGDRSTGNLPNLMNTKTLGWITQFQIEVNDNLHVLTHDIPRWEQGNIPKIANRIVQYAVYSYLFNQAMQYIKGSGKSLDPIDMGLTLLGLNDEGGDKSVMDRIFSVGGDLAKELPFASIATSGQIPTLQPVVQNFTQIASGHPVQGLEGLAASFGSPIGGGTQLQKSLTAIEAWKKGYVTDSQGKVTAAVPQNAGTLAQGVLFGKSAFDSVKKSNQEISHLDATITAQQAAAKLKNQQAANIWSQIKGLDPAQGEAQLQSIAQTDPDMAKRVIAAAKTQQAGITKEDTLIQTLGVASGARAAYIAQKVNALSSASEKEAYLQDLASKKILTAAVLTQLAALIKK